MVRRRTSPAPGVGTGQSSRRKSEGFGSPTGREARTMRLPWDMMVPPNVIVLRHRERSDLSAEAQRAKAEAIHASASGEMDCFVASAPLRKRFAFVAGNDGLEGRVHQPTSFRAGPQDRTRNLEIPRCAIAHLRFASRPGMTTSNHTPPG